MHSAENFDVIVIGGGHAGTEAALAAARMGRKTLLLSHNIETLGQMSCNPSIGGIGKGHLVKEVDALGGAMAAAADEAGIQFRILNSSKGPAVRATRAQADRMLYRQAIRGRLENQPNLWLFQQAVDDLMLEGERVTGVVTQLGIRFPARAVVLTAGTFLAGLVACRLCKLSRPDGRAIRRPSRLRRACGNCSCRWDGLKTGTPPRLDGRTHRFLRVAEQPGDDPVPVFSFMGNAASASASVALLDHPYQQPHPRHHPRRTGSLAAVHRRDRRRRARVIARPSRTRSYGFAAKESHQIFLEPEGLDTHEVYPNGISTSLPFDMQIEAGAVHQGAENAHITASRLCYRVRLFRSARTEKLA